ncbi:MAG: MFS transporter, partial [Acidimicrobiales bacterium]
MSRRVGWNVFEGPGGPPERSADHFVASPFTRLARVHALQVAGDALIALALANSLFFSIPSGEARGQVALYLVLTMAPFAVIAPFIGPAIDRAANGRRLMVILIAFSRVLIGLFMIGNLDDLLLFPAALLMLVSGKAYGIAKSAIVPTTVSTDQELIEANSKLSIITGFSGLAAGIPGLILGWIGGPTWIIGFAIVVFALGTVLAFSLPQAAVAAEPVGEAEEAELRSRGIFLAASSMGLMRA